MNAGKELVDWNTEYSFVCECHREGWDSQPAFVPKYP
jgi:hypothetical protein